MPADQIRVERLTYAGPEGPRRGGWDVQYRDLSRDRATLLFVPDAVVDAIRGSEQDPGGTARRLAIRAHVHLGEVEDAAARAHEVVRMLAGAASAAAPARRPRPAGGAPAVLRQVRA
jgi:hypothetical protein